MSINIKKKALNVKNGDTYDNFDMFFLGDVGEAVDDWFEEHPEAVTNVADNSITAAKLAPAVREEVESVTDLKSALSDVSGQQIVLTPGYIATDADPVNISNVVSHDHYYHAVVSCNEGDIFTISAKGGVTPKTVAFVDANGTRLVYSGDELTGVTLIAPENSTHLVINDYDNLKKSYYGIPTKESVNRNKNNINGVTYVKYGLNVGRNNFYIPICKQSTYTIINNVNSGVSLSLILNDFSFQKITDLEKKSSNTISISTDAIGFSFYANSATSDQIIVKNNGLIEKTTNTDDNVAILNNDITNLTNELKEITETQEIKLQSGYIDTSGNTIDITTVVPHAHYYHAVVSCNEGDIFTISATGGGSPRSFAFATNLGETIIVSDASVAVDALLVVAPENSAYLIINDYDGVHKSFIGYSISSNLFDVAGSVFGETEKSFLLSSAGHKNIYSTILQGRSYKITNDTTSSLRAALLNYDGTYGDYIDVAKSGSIIINPDNSYLGFHLYVNAAGTFKIGINSISEQIESIKQESSNNNKLDYEQIKAIASNAGMTVVDDTITRNGNTGTFDLHLAFSKTHPILVFAKCEWQDYPPYIEVNGNNLYTGIRLDFFGNGKFDISEVRLPPLECGGNTQYTVRVCLPVGTTINYLEFSEENTLARRPNYNGITINSHLGFTHLAPENTMPAFISAYRSGYDAIICNPKITSDGVWVCCHDASINTTARNLDGSTISGTIYIGDSTYNELLQYDFGIFKDEFFAGTKIPKLDDFLRLCAETGIRPIFSMHQVPTASQLESLYTIVNKYALIPELILKIEYTAYETYRSIFGKIFMYDFVTASTNAVTDTVNYITSKTEFESEPVMIDVVVTDINANLVKQITDENIICGVYGLMNTLFANYKAMIDYGVTQFTDDRYPVSGLKCF